MGSVFSLCVPLRPCRLRARMSTTTSIDLERIVQ